MAGIQAAPQRYNRVPLPPARRTPTPPTWASRSAARRGPTDGPRAEQHRQPDLAGVRLGPRRRARRGRRTARRSTAATRSTRGRSPGGSRRTAAATWRAPATCRGRGTPWVGGGAVDLRRLRERADGGEAGDGPAAVPADALRPQVASWTGRTWLAAPSANGGETKRPAPYAGACTRCDRNQCRAAATVTVSTENTKRLRSTRHQGHRRRQGRQPRRLYERVGHRRKLAGAWIQLQWASPVTVSRIALYDRPNLTDNVLAGTLTFSDGSSLAVGQLPNDGSALSTSFPARTITWVRFLVDQCRRRTTSA